jgi:uncharacterized membrane protein
MLAKTRELLFLIGDMLTVWSLLTFVASEWQELSSLPSALLLLVFLLLLFEWHRNALQFRVENI